ncbi:MAG: hypothetical protein HOL90_03520 [Candidatus Nitrosopelagicus sp.]|jgi:hypothetical protein|nr:hypothetical protein [Candidatus Nitrosopelagicus sp.]
MISKIIIGIAIAIVVIFAVMIAAMLVIGFSMMNQYEDAFIEKAIEIEEQNNVQNNPTVTLHPSTIVPSTPDCDKSYPDFCIMPSPPDLDCEDIPASNFSVVGDDAHGLDEDNDGIGCEVGSPSAPVPPSAEPVTAAQKNNCDPSYPDVCIAIYPPDLDCGEIGYSNFKVEGSDPHGFDRDNDGIGCES